MKHILTEFSLKKIRSKPLSISLLPMVLACTMLPVVANGDVIVERRVEPQTGSFYFIITNNGDSNVTVVFQIEGGDKQTLNLAPGSLSQMYNAPKQFSHPPSFWFQ